MAAKWPVNPKNETICLFIPNIPTSLFDCIAVLIITMCIIIDINDIDTCMLATMKVKTNNEGLINGKHKL